MSRLFTLLDGGNVDYVVNAVMSKDIGGVRGCNSVFLCKVRDSQGNNLLHLAVLNDDVRMAKHLLDCGVDKNCLNGFGKSAYEYAVRGQSKEMIAAFFDKEANSRVVEITDKHHKLTLEFTEVTRGMKTEIGILKVNNKRLFDDNEVLKRENGELVGANKKLKMSNDALTKAMRR